MKHQGQLGFTYCLELIAPDGTIKEREVKHNLMPIEGLNYMISAGIAAGSAHAQWYIGVYEAAYSPLPADVAATFPTTCGESTAYSASTRVPFVPGAVSQGAVDNLASRAEFTFTSNKTIRGAFVISSAAKGSTDGTLLSAAQFTSPKNVTTGDTLRITAGFDILSI